MKKITQTGKGNGKRSEPADWLVMVYLAGDNSLTDECVYSLTEMQKASRKKGVRVNIIAQFDPRDTYIPTTRLIIRTTDRRTGRLGDSIVDKAGTRFGFRGRPLFKTESRRARALEREFEAVVDALDKRIAAKAGANGSLRGKHLLFEDVVPGGANTNEHDTDTADPRRLFEFISFGIEKFRARQNILILSGHGGFNPEENFLLKDKSSGRALTIRQLKEVFRLIQNDAQQPVIDILGMDACCMSMSEIAYELRGLVKTIVASESYSPAAGWPYREILGRLQFGFSGKRLRRLQDVQAGFAKAIVDEFVNYYANYTLGGLSVDQAALNVKKAGMLRDCVHELATTLSNALEHEAKSKQNPAASSGKPVKSFKDALILAHWEAQSYSGELFVDLCDFCECLLKHYPTGKVAEACTHVIDFLKSDHFVLRSSYSGPDYQYSNGVSIYFPWANVAPFYKELEFAEHSGWGDFLERYTNETRRDVRFKRRISKRTERLLRDANFGGVMRVNSQGRRRFRQVEGKQVEGKGSENPIQSMRNPPIVYLPDVRIRAKVELIRTQGILFGGKRFVRSR